MRLGINPKLTIMTIILILIPCIVLATVGYHAAEEAVYNGVDDELMGRADDWRLLSESYQNEILAQESAAKEMAKSIVTAQAKATYELIQKELDDNNGKLTAAQKEDILDRIAGHTVGKTGYVWIIDYEGNYVLSKSRLRDGENIWEAKDSDGNFVIQDLVTKGRGVGGNDIVYHSYPWLNQGETEPREKIAAMIHFKDLEWVVGISTYYDDLVDMDYRKRTMEGMKDLVADQVIGKTGYIWVVDSEGNYVVSKNRERDGENINNAQDSDGVYFIQEAVKKAKSAGKGTDVIKYPWLNKGEKSARMKVAGLSYVEDWDWVIGVSAYYDDFQGTGTLGKVKNTLIVVTIIAVVIGILATLLFANRITAPLRRMTQAGNKIADGNLDVEIPQVRTNDEIQDLSGTMTLLVGAIRFLKTQAAEKSTKAKKK